MPNRASAHRRSILVLRLGEDRAQVDLASEDVPGHRLNPRITVLAGQQFELFAGRPSFRLTDRHFRERIGRIG